jgi:threonine/homoserine/homoserine lactone efflux protein
MNRSRAVVLVFSIAMLGVLIVFDTPGWFFPVIMLPGIIYLASSQAKKK